jgi:hypothetical protein
MMISWEGGNCFLFCRKNSRNSLLIRFRSTAPPRFFPTANPRRGRARVFGRMTTRKFTKRIFRVRGDRRIKSARLRRRSSRSKVWVWNSTAARRFRPNDRSLNRESFTAFGPPASDDIPAGPGAHPFQKTVGPGSFDIAGLKCSFHSLISPYWQKSNLYLNHTALNMSRFKKYLILPARRRSPFHKKRGNRIFPVPSFRNRPKKPV